MGGTGITGAVNGVASGVLSTDATSTAGTGTGTGSGAGAGAGVTRAAGSKGLLSLSGMASAGSVWLPRAIAVSLSSKEGCEWQRGDQIRMASG